MKSPFRLEPQAEVNGGAYLNRFAALIPPALEKRVDEWPDTGGCADRDQDTEKHYQERCWQHPDQLVPPQEPEELCGTARIPGETRVSMLRVDPSTAASIACRGAA